MNTQPKKRRLDLKLQTFDKDIKENEENRKKLRINKLKKESEFNKAINGEEDFDPRDFEGEDNGFAFVPFNLNQEREGNYHEQEEDDAWLESLDETQTSAVTSQMISTSPKTSTKKPENIIEASISLQKVISARKTIYDLMLEGEKVSACLSRMGKHKDKAILNTLMDTLDLVAIQHGDLEVYDYNKEKMHKVIKAEEEKNSRKKPTLSKKSTFFREDGVKVNDEVWEFEWVGKEGKVEGPVSLLQLKEWTDKKCFDVAKIIFWLKTKKSDRTHSNDLSEVFAVYGL